MNKLLNNFINAICEVKNTDNQLEKSLNNFINAICEVKNMDNQLLLYGRLYQVIQDDAIILDIRSHDNKPVRFVEHGLRVKLSLSKQRSELLILEGSIFGVDDYVWRINNVVAIQESERRRFFRVSIDVMGKVEKNIQLAPEDEILHDARLVDISLTGLKFASKSVFDKEERLHLTELSLQDKMPDFSFVCTVVDSFKTDSGFYIYRCLFLNMNDRDSDFLCKAIFNLQSDIVKSRKLN